MAKISSSQRHSRHLAAVGQLDFSHLLTEPKDSSTITTFDCTEQGWMDCRTFEIFKIQCSSMLIMKIIKEFIKEFIGVLLLRSGVLLSFWSFFVGYF
jgi:hypothetical protein